MTDFKDQVADYEPVDLASLRNAGTDVLGERPIGVGRRTFHGLPFPFGS